MMDYLSNGQVGESETSVTSIHSKVGMDQVKFNQQVTAFFQGHYDKYDTIQFCKNLMPTLSYLQAKSLIMMISEGYARNSVIETYYYTNNLLFTLADVTELLKLRKKKTSYNENDYDYEEVGSRVLQHWNALNH